MFVSETRVLTGVGKGVKPLLLKSLMQRSSLTYNIDDVH